VRILIAGGGIAGLTLAFWLERYGHTPIVMERSSRLRNQGYMLDFFGPGYDIAERMEILAEFASIHVDLPRMVFADKRGRPKLSVPTSNLRRLLDDRAFKFVRGDLERLLYRKIADRVEVRFRTTVNAFEQLDDRVQVTLTGGQTDEYDLHAFGRSTFFTTMARVSLARSGWVPANTSSSPPTASGTLRIAYLRDSR
jgi:2-polyprenyl-6-methoxyphenol hydroxylase-like FAD-dependent oxidoreductase